MKMYTVTLTPTEDIALGYIAASQQEWIDNAAHHRCQIAIDEIVALTVEKCLTLHLPIPTSKEEIVELAKTQGWLDRQGES
jgi:hypothetical protein